MAAARKPAAESKTVTFARTKETKNTVKFDEVPADGEPTLIGPLYVQKWFANGASEITVTVKK